MYSQIHDVLSAHSLGVCYLGVCCKSVHSKLYIEGRCYNTHLGQHCQNPVRSQPVTVTPLHQ